MVGWQSKKKNMNTKHLCRPNLPSRCVHNAAFGMNAFIVMQRSPVECRDSGPGERQDMLLNAAQDKMCMKSCSV